MDVAILKVAIVNAHYSVNLGGSEIQCHIIASELVKRGYLVDYIAVSGYQESTEFPYRLLAVDKDSNAIIGALDQVKPDIVYWRFNHRCFRKTFWTLRLKSKFIFSSSHLDDVTLWHAKSNLEDSLWFRPFNAIKKNIKSMINYATLLMCDYVLVNNSNHLKYILSSNKKFIANSIFTDLGFFEWPRPYFIWIGNIKRHKAPEAYLQACRAFDQAGVDFLIAGSIYDREYDHFKDEDSLPKNFYYLGQLEITNANAAIKGALALVHTCRPEGFPNVFLQAWALGKPVVSLNFDPQGIIKEYGVGFHSVTPSQFLIDLKHVAKAIDLKDEYSRISLALTAVKFNRQKNIDSLIEVINEVI
ncbi:MAG: hypothetical protein ACI83B_002722 [Sediminicola sp.]|jgi:hypothetical protein